MLYLRFEEINPCSFIISPPVTPSVTVTGLTGAGLSEAIFSVTCTSVGAPAITTFYRDIPGIPSIGISTYNDSTHYIIRSLSDATLATYDNTLVFDSYPSTPTELGEHACVAETTYLNALGNGQDTLTATGYSSGIFACIEIKYCL